MVDPVITPLAGMTLSLFLRSITSRFLKGSSKDKKKIAGNFLTDRLKEKAMEKLGKRALKEPLAEGDLPILREIISKELAAYGATQKEIDSLILTSLNNLAEDHTEIIQKLEDMEQLVRKITLPLALKVAGGGEELPQDLLEELMAQKLQGNPASEDVFNELVDEQQINGEMTSVLANYSFLEAIKEFEQKQLRDFLIKGESSENLNELHTYLVLSDMLSATITEDAQETLDILISQLLVNDGEKITAGPLLLPILLVLDRMNRLSDLSEKRRLQLRGILALELPGAEDHDKLELLYLMTRIDENFRVNPELVEGTLDRLAETGISDAALKKKKISLPHRVVRYFRRRKRSSDKSRARRVRNLKSLTKRLEKRKFARATALMGYQLDRLVVELSLLIVDFETGVEYEEVSRVQLDELLRTLIDILQRPATRKLNAESRLQILEALDHALYLQDLIGLTNGMAFIQNGQQTISALYKSSLGRYRRTSRETIENIVALANASQALPSPPRRREKRRKKLHG
ncbi:MAG: hypothetical protein ACE5OZ_06535 [Candidatus Heimdallarchaeota archaeon]